MNDSHGHEVAAGDRFRFGANWQRFLTVLNEARIAEAERSLQRMLRRESLQGLRFLDIGSGSGLFSLAARRLGASVHSFDYDPQSVACTTELRRRYFPEDAQWRVEAGSVLDADYMQRLGQFDVVYSWGVLHHTGGMWQALANAGQRVQAGGQLFIAIYNDQGPWSRRWTSIKRIYNRLPKGLRGAYGTLVMGGRELKFLAGALLRFRPGEYLRTWTQYDSNRGMSKWYDLIDWVGGYPFEVATPEQIFEFYRERGFTLQQMTTCAGGIGCNEFVSAAHERP